jgi:hypothetical protein
MRVGDSIRHSIEEWERGNLESSMLHACNAVDGTAKKVFTALGSNRRFTRLLRENYNILGPMGAPGINLEETRFPIAIPRPTTPDGQPDFADVIYGIHRCCHGHGEELPAGFSLIPNAAGPPGYTRMELARTTEGVTFRMSDRVVFGLLAVAVLCPVNRDQSVPSGYHLAYGNQVLPINEWWGRAAEFPTVVAGGPEMPKIKMDFSNWKT